jgi:hypothetical protein
MSRFPKDFRGGSITTFSDYLKFLRQGSAEFNPDSFKWLIAKDLCAKNGMLPRSHRLDDEKLVHAAQYIGYHGLVEVAEGLWADRFIESFRELGDEYLPAKSGGIRLLKTLDRLMEEDDEMQDSSLRAQVSLRIIDLPNRYKNFPESFSSYFETALQSPSTSDRAVDLLSGLIDWGEEPSSNIKELIFIDKIVDVESENDKEVQLACRVKGNLALYNWSLAKNPEVDNPGDYISEALKYALELQKFDDTPDSVRRIIPDFVTTVQARLDSPEQWRAANPGDRGAMQEGGLRMGVDTLREETWSGAQWRGMAEFLAGRWLLEEGSFCGATYALGAAMSYMEIAPQARKALGVSERLGRVLDSSHALAPLTQSLYGLYLRFRAVRKVSAAIKGPVIN